MKKTCTMQLSNNLHNLNSFRSLAHTHTYSYADARDGPAFYITLDEALFE